MSSRKGRPATVRFSALDNAQKEVTPTKVLRSGKRLAGTPAPSAATKPKQTPTAAKTSATPSASAAADGKEQQSPAEAAGRASSAAAATPEQQAFESTFASLTSQFNAISVGKGTPRTQAQAEHSSPAPDDISLSASVEHTQSKLAASPTATVLAKDLEPAEATLQVSPDRAATMKSDRPAQPVMSVSLKNSGQAESISQRAGADAVGKQSPILTHDLTAGGLILGLQSSPSARRSSSILQDLDSAQQQLRSICSPSPTPSHPRQPPSSTKIPAHPIPTPLPPPKATHGLSPLSKTPSSQTPPRSSLQNTPVRKAGAAKLPAGAPATPGTTASTPACTGRTPVNTPALKSWATPQGKPVFSEQAFAAALQTHQQLAEEDTDRSPGQAPAASPAIQSQARQQKPRAAAGSRHAGQRSSSTANPAGARKASEARSPTPDDIPKYVPRGQAKTPYLQSKIKAIQARDWAEGGEAKPHLSRLEREKAAAAAARSKDLPSGDKMLTKRLVQRVMSNAAKADGRGLGDDLIKHKSKLEKAKEEAVQRRKREEAAKAAAIGRSPVPPKGDWSDRGVRAALGAGPKHRSRLMLDKEAAGSCGSPRYMRNTAASERKQGSEQATVGLGETLVKHVSKLEQAKLDARKQQGDNGLIPAKQAPSSRGGSAWEGGSLGGLPKHKSRLQREQEAWKRHDKAAVAAAAAPARAPTTVPPAAAQVTVPIGSPRFMRPTKSFATRTDKAARDGPEAGGFAYVPN